eukprot:g203.t1
MGKMAEREAKQALAKEKQAAVRKEREIQRHGRTVGSRETGGGGGSRHRTPIVAANRGKPVKNNREQDELPRDERAANPLLDSIRQKYSRRKEGQKPQPTTPEARAAAEDPMPYKPQRPVLAENGLYTGSGGLLSELVAFYEKHDAQKVGIAEMMISNFEPTQLSRVLMAKYGCAPPSYEKLWKAGQGESQKRQLDANSTSDQSASISALGSSRAGRWMQEQSVIVTPMHDQMLQMQQMLSQIPPGQQQSPVSGKKRGRRAQPAELPASASSAMRSGFTHGMELLERGTPLMEAAKAASLAALNHPDGATKQEAIEIARQLALVQKRKQPPLQPQPQKAPPHALTPEQQAVRSATLIVAERAAMEEVSRSARGEQVTREEMQKHLHLQQQQLQEQQQRLQLQLQQQLQQHFNKLRLQQQQQQVPAARLKAPATLNGEQQTPSKPSRPADTGATSTKVDKAPAASKTAKAEEAEAETKKQQQHQPKRPAHRHLRGGYGQGYWSSSQAGPANARRVRPAGTGTGSDIDGTAARAGVYQGGDANAGEEQDPRREPGANAEDGRWGRGAQGDNGGGGDGDGDGDDDAVLEDVLYAEGKLSAWRIEAQEQERVQAEEERQAGEQKRRVAERIRQRHEAEREEQRVRLMSELKQRAKANSLEKEQGGVYQQQRGEKEKEKETEANITTGAGAAMKRVDKDDEENNEEKRHEGDEEAKVEEEQRRRAGDVDAAIDDAVVVTGAKDGAGGVRGMRAQEAEFFAYLGQKRAQTRQLRQQLQQQRQHARPRGPADHDSGSSGSSGGGRSGRRSGEPDEVWHRRRDAELKQQAAQIDRALQELPDDINAEYEYEYEIDEAVAAAAGGGSKQQQRLRLQMQMQMRHRQRMKASWDGTRNGRTTRCPECRTKATAIAKEAEQAATEKAEAERAAKVALEALKAEAAKEAAAKLELEKVEAKAEAEAEAEAERLERKIEREEEAKAAQAAAAAAAAQEQELAAAHAARKLQSLHRGAQSRRELMDLLEAQTNTLLSMPGTVQGGAGWYARSDGSVVRYEIEADGAWRLIEGPMTRREYRAKEQAGKRR